MAFDGFVWQRRTRRKWLNVRHKPRSIRAGGELIARPIGKASAMTLKPRRVHRRRYAKTHPASLGADAPRWREAAEHLICPSGRIRITAVRSGGSHG